MTPERATAYARGFDFGERKACQERRAGIAPTPRPADDMLPDAFSRGYWAGYTERKEAS